VECARDATGLVAHQPTSASISFAAFANKVSSSKVSSYQQIVVFGLDKTKDDTWFVGRHFVSRTTLCSYDRKDKGCVQEKGARGGIVS
jgi:hypothetical protein